MMRCVLGAVAALALMAVTAAAAHDYTAGSLKIGHPWTRVTPGASTTGSAYLSVTNTGTAMDRLIGASSPAAARAELHTHQMDGSAMRMRPVEAVAVPPGESAVLKPGGLHIMLIGLKEPIREGRRVPLTLHFEKAGSVDVELAVEAVGATGAGHAGHDGTH